MYNRVQFLPQGAHNVNVRESDLPGIGRKFLLETREGEKLAVILHDDGRRELYRFDKKDPDEVVSFITLQDDEARQLAGILGGLSYLPRDR